MLVRPFTASSSDTVPAIQGKKNKNKKSKLGCEVVVQIMH